MTETRWGWRAGRPSLLFLFGLVLSAVSPPAAADPPPRRDPAAERLRQYERSVRYWLWLEPARPARSELESSVQEAAWQGYQTVVDLLLRHGATIDVFVAAGLGMEDRVRELLAKDPGLVKKTASNGYTALHFAAHNGHARVVRLLLEHKADPRAGEVQGDDDRSVLGAALARQSNREVVELLLRAGADPNAGRVGDFLPLCAAAISCDAPVVELLLRFKAKVNEGAEHGDTALLSAAFIGHQPGVPEVLLAAGADTHVRGSGGQSALHMAAGFGRAEMVQALLKHGADLHARDGSGWTPLMCATMGLQLDIARQLVDKGARLDLHSAIALGRLDDVARMLTADPALATKRVARMNSPLHWAARNGSAQMVHLLVGHGARPNSPEMLMLLREGGICIRHGPIYYPLHLAALHGNAAAASVLLDHKARIDAPTEHGQTPLVLAVESGHKDVVRLFLDCGAGRKPDEARTLLNLAARHNRKEVVALFLDRKVPLNEGDWPPLHTAAAYGHKDLVAWLLDRGARVNAANRNGETPLHEAAKGGHLAVVELLLARGAAVDARDQSLSTPLHRAAGGDHLEVVKVLVRHKADLDARDRERAVPRQWALHSRAWDTYAYLRSLEKPK